MNENNFDYLKDSLKYMGFGESLHEALRGAISEGKKDFTLGLQTEVGGRPFSATLHFRKSDQTDHYFFNKWEADLKSEVGKMQHTFYVNKGHGVTLKEGFNLLEGRAVHKELTNKEGQKYGAWLQLDGGTIDKNGNSKLRQYHHNYGYDLEGTLARLPIRELAHPEQKERLLYSLQKGNRPAVTFEKNGFAEKLHIEAAPKFKSLNVYDHNGVRIPPPELEKRFEVSLGPAREELTPLGRAKVNNAPVQETGGQPVHQQRAVPPQEGKEVKKETPAPRPSLLPRKEGTEGLLPKKKASRGKGLQI